MVAVIVSYTCPVCSEVFIKTIVSHNNKIFEVPDALCAACGTAPKMAVAVEKVTSTTAIENIKSTVLAEIDEEVLTELNKS